MILEFVRRLAGKDTAQLVTPADPLPTSPLRQLGAARNLAVGAASTSVALTADCTAISVSCVGCNARIRIGSGAQTAVTTDHRLVDSVPYDLAVAAGSTVAVIAESGTGALAISELGAAP